MSQTTSTSDPDPPDQKRTPPVLINAQSETDVHPPSSVGHLGTGLASGHARTRGTSLPTVLDVDHERKTSWRRQTGVSLELPSFRKRVASFPTPGTRTYLSDDSDSDFGRVDARVNHASQPENKASRGTAVRRPSEVMNGILISRVVFWFRLIKYDDLEVKNSFKI